MRFRAATSARLAAVVALVAISTGIEVFPAEAVVPTLAAPERVYTGVDVPLAFTGTDPISGDVKDLEVTAPSAGCDPLADGPDPGSAPDYDIGGCARVQLGVINGVLAIPMATTLGGVSQPDGIAVGGAIVESSTNGDGSGLVVNLNGTQTQLTDALATLTWTPESGYEDTNGTTRLLEITVVDGNSADNVQKDVELRVEGLNQGPDLTVPGAPIPVAAGSTAAVPAVAPPIGVNGEFFVEDPDLDQGSTDDRLLLVMFTTCGQFSIRGGSLTIDDEIDDLLVAAGFDQTVADGIIALLPSEVTGQAFATSAPGDPKVAMAALGEIEEVDYALSQVSFLAPATDGSCELWTVVSDLGNNGMPLQYVGSPIGGADDPQPGFEVPDAGVDVDVANFVVGAGARIDVPEAVNVDEGTSIDIPVTITSADHPEFSISVTPADITATAATDYTAPPSPQVYPADSPGPLQLLLPAAADADVEGPETFTLTIGLVGSPPGVTVGEDTVTVTINDTTVDPTTTTTTTEPGGTTTSTSTTTSTTTTTEPGGTTTSTTEPGGTTTTSTTEPGGTTTTSTSEPGGTTSTSSTTTTTEPGGTTTTEPGGTTTTSTTEPAGTTTSTTEPTTSTTEPTTTSSTTTAPTTTSSTPTTSTTQPTTSTTTSTTEPDGSTTTTSTTAPDGTTSTTSDVSPTSVIATTPPAGSGPGVRGGGLARTGSDVAGPVATAVALLTFGGAFVWRSRRRRVLAWVEDRPGR